MDRDIENTFPNEYIENMKELLGEEYEAYIDSMEEPSYHAIRFNKLKDFDRDSFVEKYKLKRIPWCETGYYYESAELSKNPYYYAGLYYIQEPSAMIPASLLGARPGDRVLDLCAAPGGKSTQIAGDLQGEGVLFSNDISSSRAMALAKNIEICGIRNAIVSSEKPEKLSLFFSGYFDKIVIDAPCSGEGMFRRDSSMIKDWLEKGPKYYSEIQYEILEEAYKMLKAGGKMVYSTCTFSPLENEDNINKFLLNHPDMHIGNHRDFFEKAGENSGLSQGFFEGNEDYFKGVRAFPHKLKGEGHFAVLLEKDGECPRKEAETGKKVKKAKKFSFKDDLFEAIKDRLSKGDFWGDSLGEKEDYFFEVINDKLFLIPSCFPKLKGIRIIYQGLLIGDCKNKLKLSTNFALAIKKFEEIPYYSFEENDVNVIKYLKGESLNMGDVEPENSDKLKAWKNYVLIVIDGEGLGFAKYSNNGMLKNMYNKGWRLYV